MRSYGVVDMYMEIGVTVVVFILVQEKLYTQLNVT